MPQNSAATGNVFDITGASGAAVSRRDGSPNGPGTGALPSSYPPPVPTLPPVPGATKPVEYIDGSDLSHQVGETLTIAQATARYSVSRATLQRRLNENAIPGAFKHSSIRGEEWRLPVASLERMFGQAEAAALERVEEEGRRGASPEDMTVLLKLLADLRADLRNERENRRLELTAARQETDEKERLRIETAERAARLEGELTAAARHATEVIDTHKKSLVELEVQVTEEKSKRHEMELETERMRSVLSRRQMRKLERLRNQQ